MRNGLFKHFAKITKRIFLGLQIDSYLKPFQESCHHSIPVSKLYAKMLFYFVGYLFRHL